MNRVITVATAICGILMMAMSTINVAFAACSEKSVEGAWGPGSCNENNHCVYYKHGDTCTYADSTSACVIDGTDYTYCYSDCILQNGSYTCNPIGTLTYGGSQTSYGNTSCPTG